MILAIKVLLTINHFFKLKEMNFWYNKTHLKRTLVGRGGGNAFMDGAIPSARLKANKGET